MNEEIDESEFYHQDFTTASDWEIFVSRIEEIVNQWKLDESRDINKDGQSIWITKSEKLMFADTEFEFLYYKKINGLDGCLSKEPSKWKYTKIENSVDLGYDFQYFDRNISNTHSNLYIWYGLTEYFVLSPSGKEGITSESKIKVLLSSLHLVVNSLKCKIPFFVQIQEKWQNCYLGVLETFDESVQIRTNFEMIHLGWVPKWCQHLSSLLKLFTSKIMSPEELGYIYSSVQYTFHLSDFGNYLWQQDIFSLRSDLLDIMPSFELPFGVTVDPINLLQLKTTWLDVPSFNVYDNESSSSFKPELSHQWSVLVQMYDQTVCILSDCLLDYLSLLDNNSRVFDIILEYSPIDALVESKVTNIPSILSKAARNSMSGSRKEGSVISEEVLVSFLYYLFPDAEQHEPKSPYHLMNENQQNDSNNSPQKATIQDLDKQCKGFKTCPHDSLLWRFAVISALLQHTGGGFRAFAQLWYEFVQEMRYRWDKNIIISGLINGFPDLRTCLLNQKLQMLNCCIERKKAREEHQRDVFEYESAEGSSTDDEFFDCADKSDEEMKKVHPVGRLSKFQNLKLIEAGEPLYIPKTQEPVPKTEDQLDEDADVLLKLGTDAQGSEMRAKLMSASLLSDMESFKAANPGAILEDFVRWYSPRDWEETKENDQWGQKKGTLSTRMQIENNIWAQMWKSAKPVPANKQKLLFVDSKEAEKVLHFLESRTISQVCELLLPILLQAAIYRLATEAAKLDVELDNGSAKLQNLIKTSECISRERKLPARRVETIVQEMAPIEFDISTVNSLKYKLNPSGKEYDGFAESLSKLVKGKEVKIEKESEIGKQILTLFSDAQNNANLVKEEDNKEVKSVLNSPKVREYVMRIDAVRPAIYSAISPQFLRVIITKDDIRMAGAFSEDIGFF